MALNTKIDSTFSTLACRYDEQVTKTAERLPTPVGAVVRRVGAIQAEAIRQYGLVLLTTVDAAERFVRVAWSGATDFAISANDAVEDSARTLRNLGERAFQDVEDAAETIGRRARGAAQAVERRFEELGDDAEAVEDRVERSASKQGRRLAKAADTAIAETAEEGTNGQSGSYENWTKEELYERAQELEVDGRSTMSKDELVTALQSA